MENYNAVKAFIITKENINKKSNGLTPLMFALRNNKMEIIQLLIKHGAKLKTKSKKGNLTALDIAKKIESNRRYKST